MEHPRLNPKQKLLQDKLYAEASRLGIPLYSYLEDISAIIQSPKVLSVEEALGVLKIHRPRTYNRIMRPNNG